MNKNDEKTRRPRHRSNSAVTGCAMRKDSSLQQDQTVGSGNKQDQQEKKRISQLHTVKHSAHAYIECPMLSSEQPKCECSLQFHWLFPAHSRLQTPQLTSHKSQLASQSTVFFFTGQISD